ncbi:MAG: hypothetical protein ACK526_08705 [Planctomyces sp.]
MAIAAQQDFRSPEMFLLRDLRVLLCNLIFHHEDHEALEGSVRPTVSVTKKNARRVAVQ